MIFGLRGLFYYYFIFAKAFKHWFKNSGTDAFWGPVHILTIINNSNDSKHLKYLSIFVASWEMLVWWCILHRYASTNRRRYAQQPLHRASFKCTCSYIERFVHRETFTRRRLYTQSLLRKEALHTEARSSAEPALLLFELLSVFLFPLPDHLPFVFPFPSIIPSIANLGIYLEIPLYNGRQGSYTVCLPSPQVLCFTSGKTVFRPEESSLW